MDTLKSWSSWRRRWRIAVFLSLMLLVSGVLAYLVSWIEPSREVCFVPIHIAGYDAGPLAHLGQAGSGPTFPDSLDVGSNRQDIEQALGTLVQHGHQPVVVYVSALAVRGGAGQVFLLPRDASLNDAATWLPLRDVLAKLQACPARHKLLVLDLTPAPVQLGNLYHDLASALPRELDAVPDDHRLVLCAASAGQTSHGSSELGQSVFGHYFQEALRGHADGRDGRITVKAVAAFVQASVERWTWHNRGATQTPMLLGAGRDFTLATIDPAAPREVAALPAPRNYPDWLLDAWRARDSAYQSGQYRLAPRLFQQQQATLLALEQAWRNGHPEATLRKRWLAECDRLQDALQRMSSDLVMVPPLRDPASDVARTHFEERWRSLQQQLVDLKPAEADRLRTRFINEMRGKLPPGDRAAIVFATALAEPRLDSGTLRLYDRLLHAAPNVIPASAEGLRLRQLADLALRGNGAALPPELIETLLRCTASAEKAFGLQPSVPGFVSLLAEPALARHNGEVYVWTHGYSNLDEATGRLAKASGQFDRLTALNERWRHCEKLLDETLAELPWYLDALEAMPELRTPWEQAASAARRCAEALKITSDPKKPWDERVDRLAALVGEAEKHGQALTRHRQALHAPFGRDALAKLARECRAPRAAAATRNTAAALLSVAAPVLSAEDRAGLWRACQIPSRRLNEETRTQDGQGIDAPHLPPNEINASPAENEPSLAALRARWQLALLELAGVSADALRPARQRLERCNQDAKNPASWCKLGAALRRLGHDQMPQQYRQEPASRERERLAWLMPCLERFAGIDDAKASPTIERRRRDNESHEQWLHEQNRYLACAYHGLNFESPGIVAARGFYARAAGTEAASRTLEPSVQVKATASIEPLTAKQPYADIILEVTRRLPAGAFGPLELRIHHAENAWLEIAPMSAMLPALAESKEPRTLTHKVPLKVALKPGAERTGLPPPLGFLVEAQLEGRSYHHLVTTPIVPDTQEVQILVSADPDEPTTTLHDLRLRPGNVRQPHFVYVKNLTDRAQQVHVEIRTGATLVHKTQQPSLLEPDGVRKIVFDEPDVKLTEVTGPLTVRVLDQARQKVLHERTLAVEILSPRNYIKIADVSYEPGRQGQSKWTIQVQATRALVGPAIAAQLVLPMQRIPGLIGIGGGTLQVEVPTHLTTARTLFAEGIRLVRGAEEEGPVYLNIDGVPRAFVYRTLFNRAGAGTQPRADDRVAVRLLAPPCVMSGVHLLVDVEVDNAPKGATLEVALGRGFDEGSFRAEIVREFTDAKKRRIDLEASNGALTFEASIGDWTASFDTRAIVGARMLQAKLLDVGGQVIASCRQSLVLDDSPPLARFMPTVAAVKKGSVLHVQAQGLDPESGVAKVVFFFGREERGEIPQGVARFKAIPASRDQSVWTAALLIPGDHTGPVALSVYVLNHAGLATIDTITLDVTDDEPGKTGLGQIHGQVLEGPRPQPNHLVTLLDERGKEIARTHTQRDGTYQFERVSPGHYRIQCVKPESQRRAIVDVTIEADRTARIDLALAL